MATSIITRFPITFPAFFPPVRVKASVREKAAVREQTAVREETPT